MTQGIVTSKIHKQFIRSKTSNRRAQRHWLPAVCFAAMASLPAPLLASFLTSEPAMIDLEAGAPAGSSVLPIINSGEGVGGFTFQGLPDGIGLAPGPNTDSIDVFVAHEETTVPFFNRADFQDASVSRLTLSTATTDMGHVLDASVALPATAGFLRFCSAFMGGPTEGYSFYTFFAGEESNDIVPVPAGAPYGPDPALAPERQAGYVVALDVHTGEYRQIPGLGRLNHENTITVPGGWKGFTLLSTDDTFNAPSAQLYMYRANHESHIWEDKGSLWAFRVTGTGKAKSGKSDKSGKSGKRGKSGKSDKSGKSNKSGKSGKSGKVDASDPFNNANDYLDLQPGDVWQGEFIRVPKDIARGQTDVAPQDALEDWSNENNIFQFIRLEDLAYDRNNPRIVYVADTGRSRIVPDASTGRMMRGPSGTVGSADNGRIFKFVFNKKNPRKVDGFSVLADADAPGTPEYLAMRAPDNMDTSNYSLMVQEDTSDAKIWKLDFATGAWSHVATVNDLGGESSGIVDASQWFGAGSWILDVQGSGEVLSVTDPVSGVTNKLSTGQLLLMNLPGS